MADTLNMKTDNVGVALMTNAVFAALEISKHGDNPAQVGTDSEAVFTKRLERFLKAYKEIKQAL